MDSALRTYEKLRYHVKGVVGRLLGMIWPGERDRIAELQLTNPGWTDGWTGSARSRLIRFGVYYRLAKDKHGDELALAHQRYWSNQQSRQYYQGTYNRFAARYQSHYESVAPDIAAICEELSIETLVEVGTGAGQLLEFLSRKIPLARYVGLDLSASQIAANRDAYPGTKLVFHAGDAVEWIRANGTARTIFVANGGVLEYFSPIALSHLLGIIASLRPSALYLLESAYAGKVEHESVVAPGEFSFRHAYPSCLRQAGFALRRHRLVPIAEEMEEMEEILAVV